MLSSVCVFSSRCSPAAAAPPSSFSTLLICSISRLVSKSSTYSWMPKITFKTFFYATIRFIFDEKLEMCIFRIQKWLYKGLIDGWIRTFKHFLVLKLFSIISDRFSLGVMDVGRWNSFAFIETLWPTVHTYSYWFRQIDRCLLESPQSAGCLPWSKELLCSSAWGVRDESITFIDSKDA